VKALLIPAGLCVVALPAVLIGAATQALTGGTTAQAAGSTAGLLGQIPADYLALYEAAAGRCPGLPWTVLAAVGTVETDNGANTATSTAGAQGPMQFEPGTWARWGIDGDGDGIANINDPVRLRRSRRRRHPRSALRLQPLHRLRHAGPRRRTATRHRPRHRQRQ
jgi:hypothetical protein